MFRYTAPNPYKESCFSSFFSFPSSKSISKLVLPAQLYEPVNVDEAALNEFTNQYNLVVQSGCVETYDGAILDTIELKPKSVLDKPLNKQDFIIKFNGNGMLYQNVLQNFAYDANKLGVTVIGFNYRGVGNSKKTPTVFQDLVTDGIAEVQRLLDSGVDSKRITVDGLSLGGGVATMVASYFHKNGNPIYLWNDRSFASVSKAAAGMFMPEAKDIFSGTLEYASWSVMKPVGWDVNVANAYKTIPAAYKNHMYVAKKSDRSDGDGVIAHWASLHEGVKKEEKERGVSTGHKVYAKAGLFRGGHNMSRGLLVSAEDPSFSGQDQFEKFVKSHQL